MTTTTQVDWPVPTEILAISAEEWGQYDAYQEYLASKRADEEDTLAKTKTRVLPVAVPNPSKWTRKVKVLAGLATGTLINLFMVAWSYAGASEGATVFLPFAGHNDFAPTMSDRMTVAVFWTGIALVGWIFLFATLYADEIGNWFDSLPFAGRLPIVAILVITSPLWIVGILFALLVVIASITIAFWIWLPVGLAWLIWGMASQSRS